MTDDELFSLFDNWARWCKDKYHEDPKCKSIEKFYRSPQTWHPPEARAPDIDWISAMEVEKQVTYLRRSANRSFNGYAELLKGHHVLKANPKATCRKAKIRIWARNQIDWDFEYKAVLKVAQLTVKNRMKG